MKKNGNTAGNGGSDKLKAFIVFAGVLLAFYVGIDIYIRVTSGNEQTLIGLIIEKVSDWLSEIRRLTNSGGFL